MCPENYRGVSQADEERSVPRRQIRAYWEVVSDHLDKIVSGRIAQFIASSFGVGCASEWAEFRSHQKALQRVPSVTDDTYEEIVALQPPTVSTYWTATAHADSSSLSNSNLVDPVVVRVSRSEDMHESPAVQVDSHSLLSPMRGTTRFSAPNSRCMRSFRVSPSVC